MTVFERLKDIIVDRLRVPLSKITEDANFLEDLGADSLDVIELIMAIEDTFGIEVPDEDIEKVITVGDAVRYIKKKTGEN